MMNFGSRMDLERIRAANLKVATMATTQFTLVGYDGEHFNYLHAMELYEDDDWVQRAIVNDDRIIHVTDVIVVGSDAMLAFQTLAVKKGCYAFAKLINATINDELKQRKAAKKAYKRWETLMRRLVRDLFIYDFDLLDDALDDPEAFISDYVLLTKNDT